MPSYRHGPTAGGSSLGAAGISPVPLAPPKVTRLVQQSCLRCICRPANSCRRNDRTSRVSLHQIRTAAAGAAFPTAMPAKQSVSHVAVAFSTGGRASGCILHKAATSRSKAACCATQESWPSQEDPNFARSVYIDADAQPQHFVGPITVSNIPGKGRGLVATAPLVPGQLLLVVPPLAILEGHLGDIPEHEELIEVITDSGALYSPWQADWLRALTTTVSIDSGTENQGIASSSSNHSDSLQQRQAQQQSDVVPEVPAFLPPSGQGAWMGAGAPDAADNDDDSAGAFASDAAGAARVPFAGVGMDEERLWAATVLNCYGEGFPDLPASLCAGAPLHSQLGLWGAFSLINHACCPNAVNYTLRDCMVVRCCAAAVTGEEVTINYLGRSALLPLSQRQTELEASYGFMCRCRRCCAEATWREQPSGQAGVSLSDFLDQLHLQIGQDFEPRQALLVETQQDMQLEDSSDSDSSSQSEQQQQHQQQQLLQELKLQWSHLQEAARRLQGSSSKSDSMGKRGTSLELSSDSTAAGAPERQLAAAPAAAATDGWQQHKDTGVPVSMEDEEAAAWVLASGFDLLGLLYDVAEGCEQHERSVLAAIVTVCEQVCPGSDLHIFQALRLAATPQQQLQQQQEPLLRQKSEQDGRRGEEQTSNADERVVRALQIRYGPEAVAEQVMLDRMRGAAAQAADMVWL